MPRPWSSRPTTCAPATVATQISALEDQVAGLGPLPRPAPRSPTATTARSPRSTSPAAAPARTTPPRTPSTRSATRSSRPPSASSTGSVPTSAATPRRLADSRDQSNSRLPLIFAFVFGLAFLLMLVTFRSIVIPIKAIVLNLLSVGAAYGVLVLVFQNGCRRVAARLRVQRRRRLLAAAVPVRDPVRALDGLPRVHPLPGPRGLRPRDEHRRCRPPRDLDHRGHRDQRCAGDGRRVRGLRHAAVHRPQGARASASPWRC